MGGAAVDAQRAALTADDVLGVVEREAAEVTDGAQLAALIGGHKACTKQNSLEYAVKGTEMWHAWCPRLP